jgi:hypothetical protein
VLDAAYCEASCASHDGAGLSRHSTWLRRLLGVAVAALGAVCALSYVDAFADRRREQNIPVQLGGIALLVHALPFAAVADVWFCARPFAGFEPRDAPTSHTVRRHAARMLMVLGLACTAAGGGLLRAGAGPSRDEPGSTRALIEDEAPLSRAEHCYLVWGVGDTLHQDLGANEMNVPGRFSWHSRGEPVSVDMIEAFDPADAAAQTDLAAMCDLLFSPASPMNSQEKERGRRPVCPMAIVRERDRADFPLTPREHFNATFKELVLDASTQLRWLAGYRDTWSPTAPTRVPTDRIAWLMVRLHSQFDAADGALIGQPQLMRAYMREWKEWFAGLPAAANGTSGVLSHGFVSCASWRLYPTLSAFLDGVYRSLVFTPCDSTAHIVHALPLHSVLPSH